jgi:hypothetical protein
MLQILLAAILSGPAYWTVHIDQPRNRAEFERIDAQFNATIRDFYTAHNLTPPPVWRIMTVDGAYVGLRPRGALADLAVPPLPPDLSKELQVKTAPISEATHKILRAHHSELWQLQRDLTTRLDDPAPRKYSLMRTDVVDPPRDEEYEQAMKELVHELAGDGVETVAFFSSYGDGAYHYIFSSAKPVRVRKLPDYCHTRDVAITNADLR